MKKYVGTGSRLSKTGVLISLAIHVLILAIPISLIVIPVHRDKDKKIELVFEKPKPPVTKPKPRPPKPKPKPKPQQKPAPAPKPVQEPPKEVSPIETDVVDEGGIDLPSGPVYEDVYVPSPAVCGNGEVEENEQCDDGNTLDGDGCSASCAVEYMPACGNGVIDDGEACDDGNTAGGDECAADCSRVIDRQGIISDYQRELFSLIEKNKKYPPAARRRGIQGGVGVGFTIMPDGSHTNLRVTETSGNNLLDDGAVKTIQSIQNFPPPPPDLGMNEMSIELTIVFKLR